MKTRAAVLWEVPGKWQVQEVDLDDPGPTEVLVEMAATGLCHSDDHLPSGDMTAGHLPAVGGHEGAGIVRAVGAEVHDVKPGDHVITSFIPACGKGRWCAMGMQNLCDNGAIILEGTQPAGGFRMHSGTADIATMAALGTFAEWQVYDHTGPIRSVRVLGAGVPVVVMEHFDPVGLLELIQAYRVATCLLVPTHFVRLLALPEEIRHRYDVSSLAFVVQTGSACPVDVKRRMIDWWGPIFQEGYGSTESRMVATISSEEWLRKPGSVGRVVPPYVRGFAVDAAGRELPPGRAGVLYFEDSTGRGIEYRGDPEKTSAAHLAPGVFTLGEVGYADEDGYIFVTDRVNDLIVSGGVNIYPAEAETVLVTHPKVAEVIVIGVPDPEFGESAKALVIPRLHPTRTS